MPWIDNILGPNFDGETGVATNVGLWKLALDLVSEEEAPLGVARSLSVQIMFPVVKNLSPQ